MAHANGTGVLTRRKLLGGLAASAGAGLAVFSTSAAQDSSNAKEGPRPIDIEARPISHFLRSSPDERRFGALEFRGGLVLTSSSRDFGGWSGPRRWTPTAAACSPSRTPARG